MSDEKNANANANANALDNIPHITDPEGSRIPAFRKFASIMAFLIVLVVVGYFLRFPFTRLFFPKVYAAQAAENTIKELSREIGKFAGNNPVVKQALAIWTEPTVQTLRFGGADDYMRIYHDGRRAQLQADLYNVAGFHLSDVKAGVRLADDYYGFTPVASAEELALFLSANGVYGVSLPEDLDLSYTSIRRSIQTGELRHVSPALYDLQLRYSALLDRLFDSASVKFVSADDISIGSIMTKTTGMQVEISASDLKEWLSLLADTIRADEALHLYAPSRAEAWENKIRTLADSELQKFFATSYVYQNRIIQLDLAYGGADDIQPVWQVTLKTVGLKFRLDELSIALQLPSISEDQILLEAKGSHIEPGIFTSVIHISDIADARVIWDPAQSSNNLQIDSKRYTLTADDGRIVFHASDKKPNGVSYTLEGIEERPLWPETAKPMSDLVLRAWLTDILE